MRLLYNESECCAIMRESRAMDKMIRRLIVRQYDWTCDARAILRLIARVPVPVKGDMYFAFLISLQYAAKNNANGKNRYDYTWLYY